MWKDINETVSSIKSLKKNMNFVEQELEKAKLPKQAANKPSKHPKNITKDNRSQYETLKLEALAKKSVPIFSHGFQELSEPKKNSSKINFNYFSLHSESESNSDLSYQIAETGNARLVSAKVLNERPTLEFDQVYPTFKAFPVDTYAPRAKERILHDIADSWYENELKPGHQKSCPNEKFSHSCEVETVFKNILPSPMRNRHEDKKPKHYVTARCSVKRKTVKCSSTIREKNVLAEDVLEDDSLKENKSKRNASVAFKKITETYFKSEKYAHFMPNDGPQMMTTNESSASKEHEDNIIMEAAGITRKIAAAEPPEHFLGFSEKGQGVKMKRPTAVLVRGAEREAANAAVKKAKHVPEAKDIDIITTSTWRKNLVLRKSLKKPEKENLQEPMANAHKSAADNPSPGPALLSWRKQPKLKPKEDAVNTVETKKSSRNYDRTAIQEFIRNRKIERKCKENDNLLQAANWSKKKEEGLKHLRDIQKKQATLSSPAHRIKKSLPTTSVKRIHVQKTRHSDKLKYPSFTITLSNVLKANHPKKKHAKVQTDIKKRRKISEEFDRRTKPSQTQLERTFQQTIEDRTVKAAHSLDKILPQPSEIIGDSMGRAETNLIEKEDEVSSSISSSKSLNTSKISSSVLSTHTSKSSPSPRNKDETKQPEISSRTTPNRATSPLDRRFSEKLDLQPSNLHWHPDGLLPDPMSFMNVLRKKYAMQSRPSQSVPLPQCLKQQSQQSAEVRIPVKSHSNTDQTQPVPFPVGTGLHQSENLELVKLPDSAVNKSVHQDSSRIFINSEVNKEALSVTLMDMKDLANPLDEMDIRSDIFEDLDTSFASQDNLLGIVQDDVLNLDSLQNFGLFGNERSDEGESLRPHTENRKFDTQDRPQLVEIQTQQPELVETSSVREFLFPIDKKPTDYEEEAVNLLQQLRTGIGCLESIHVLNETQALKMASLNQQRFTEFSQAQQEPLVSQIGTYEQLLDGIKMRHQEVLLRTVGEAKDTLLATVRTIMAAPSNFILKASNDDHPIVSRIEQNPKVDYEALNFVGQSESRQYDKEEVDSFIKMQSQKSSSRGSLNSDESESKSEGKGSSSYSSDFDESSKTIVDVSEHFDEESVSGFQTLEPISTGSEFSENENTISEAVESASECSMKSTDEGRNEEQKQGKRHSHSETSAGSSLSNVQRNVLSLNQLLDDVNDDTSSIDGVNSIRADSIRSRTDSETKSISSKRSIEESNYSHVDEGSRLSEGTIGTSISVSERISSLHQTDESLHLSSKSHWSRRSFEQYHTEPKLDFPHRSSSQLSSSVKMLSPLVPVRRSPYKHSGHSSTSGEESSHFSAPSETLSEQSDIEGRIIALREQLKKRKSEASRLSKELKRRHRESLKQKEISLHKQIEAYESFIRSTKDDLEQELELSKLSLPVSLKITKPRIISRKKESRSRSSTVHSGTSIEDNIKSASEFSVNDTSIESVGEVFLPSIEANDSVITNNPQIARHSNTAVSTAELSEVILDLQQNIGKLHEKYLSTAEDKTLASKDEYLKEDGSFPSYNEESFKKDFEEGTSSHGKSGTECFEIMSENNEFDNEREISHQTKTGKEENSKSERTYQSEHKIPVIETSETGSADQTLVEDIKLDVENVMSEGDRLSSKAAYAPLDDVLTQMQKSNDDELDEVVSERCLIGKDDSGSEGEERFNSFEEIMFSSRENSVSAEKDLDSKGLLVESLAAGNMVEPQKSIVTNILVSELLKVGPEPEVLLGSDSGTISKVNKTIKDVGLPVSGTLVDMLVSEPLVPAYTEPETQNVELKIDQDAAKLDNKGRDMDKLLSELINHQIDFCLCISAQRYKNHDEQTKLQSEKFAASLLKHEPPVPSMEEERSSETSLEEIKSITSLQMTFKAAQAKAITDMIVQNLVEDTIHCAKELRKPHSDLNHSGNSTSSDEPLSPSQVSQRVSDILLVLNDRNTKSPPSKYRPQDLMVLSPGLDEQDWILEKERESTVLMPSLDVDIQQDAEWFEDDFGLPSKPSEFPTRSQVPYYYRQIPDKPPPPYTPPQGAMLEKLAKLGCAQLPPWSIPNSEQEVQQLLKSSAKEIFEQNFNKGLDLEKVHPSDEYLKTESKFDDIMAKNERAYKLLVFDLCKEAAIKIKESSMINENLDPWRRPSTWIRSEALPESESKFVELIQKLAKSELVASAPSGLATKYKHKKHDFVDALLLQDLGNEELDWVNYEQDEVTVKLFVADSIFAQLVEETVLFLKRMVG